MPINTKNSPFNQHVPARRRLPGAALGLSLLAFLLSPPPTSAQATYYWDLSGGATASGTTTEGGDGLWTDNYFWWDGASSKPSTTSVVRSPTVNLNTDTTLFKSLRLYVDTGVLNVHSGSLVIDYPLSNSGNLHYYPFSIGAGQSYEAVPEEQRAVVNLNGGHIFVSATWTTNHPIDGLAPAPFNDKNGLYG
ncbi:MAG: hypothetical protein LBI02_05655 [Opitutaceae bacterium]|nr:hypothetical protein [Opitutaceae bacterium]